MTIKEIASLAGVSRTTVSRVLNNRPDVSPETMARVTRVIEENNYTPNALAKAINAKQSNTIGIVIPYDEEYIFTSQYFVELLRGISTCITDRSYYAMLCYVRNDDYLSFYKTGRVDGYIIISPDVRHSSLVEELISHSIPFYMTADISNIHGNAHFIDVDDRLGAHKAVEYLIQLGHRKIAYLGETSAISSLKRLDEYKKCLTNHGIEVREQYINLMSEYNLSAMGQQMTRAVMNLPDPPTAFFCSADMVAIGCNSALHELGYRVPDDVSIVGFDNIFLCKYMVPSLTTVSQPAFKKGYMAANIFIDHLSLGKPLINKYLDIDLIVRNSTAPPPSASQI